MITFCYRSKTIGKPFEFNRKYDSSQERPLRKMTFVFIQLAFRFFAYHCVMHHRNTIDILSFFYHRGMIISPDSITNHPAMKNVYLRAEDIDFELKTLPDRPEPSRILMSSPDFFNVSEAINKFMTNGAGNLNVVDREKAFQQWSNIRWHYESLGYTVSVLRSQDGLEDMVFSANQSFPFMDRKTGKPAVIMSNMRKEKRKPEVAYFHTWYRRHGYEVFYLKNCSFESNGDALWYPGKYLIISGFGSHEHHRTDLAALYQIAEIIDCPVVGIELTHPDFYHLNTTLAIIDHETCIAYKPGVGKEGHKILETFFKHIIDVDKSDAYDHFACNAFSLDGHTVLIQKTAKKTIKKLEAFGKHVIPVDTSEFIKSGGSVFCMKMKVY